MSGLDFGYDSMMRVSRCMLMHVIACVITQAHIGVSVDSSEELPNDHKYEHVL